MQAVFLDAATLPITKTMPNGITLTEYAASTPDEIAARAQNADILLVNKTVLTRQTLEQLPNLKFIQITATGMNNVDLDACGKLGIIVKNVSGYSTDSVPEHTFMLMLGAMRAGLCYHKRVANGDWQKDGKFCLNDTPILDLNKKTLGIIGAGNIGTRVAEIARAFGMNVLLAERQNANTIRTGRTAFADVLAHADIITLHCPLTDETRQLINANTIAQMAKKPLVINVARGGVVDAQAIKTALDSGKILGFCTDVFTSEPPAADCPYLSLANHPRVFLTPHNAWSSEQAQQNLWAGVVANLEQFVQTRD